MDPSPLSVNEAFFDEVRRNVRAAIVEDVGSGDINAALISTDQLATAHLITRTAGVFCGQPWADETCQQIDTSITLEWLVHDGQSVTPGDALLVAHGPARSLLTCERIMLNFIQLLSGTATAASQYVEAISETSAKILDTRKTVPGLRIAQKYAVAVAGAKNHRLGLFDAYLIKENHIAACGGISEVISKVRTLNLDKPVEIEVQNLTQLQEALVSGANKILLDNFDILALQEAVKINQGQSKLEASGGIDQDLLVKIAETGVDYISIGALTKHCRAIDLSLLID